MRLPFGSPHFFAYYARKYFFIPKKLPSKKFPTIYENPGWQGFIIYQQGRKIHNRVGKSGQSEIGRG